MQGLYIFIEIACFLVNIPRGFLLPRIDETRERKKQQEKTSGSGRCESHYHATIGVNQHHEIDYKNPITTHP